MLALTVWDDANSNQEIDGGETVNRSYFSVTGHSMSVTNRLDYGNFGRDGDNLPDWWEVANGLSSNGVTWSPYWGPMIPHHLNEIQSVIDEWDGEDSTDNNVWFLSYYGELLNDAALESAVRIPLVDWADTECSGGVLVEDTSDFYLGFNAWASAGTGTAGTGPIRPIFRFPFSPPLACHRMAIVV